MPPVEPRGPHNQVIVRVSPDSPFPSSFRPPISPLWLHQLIFTIRLTRFTPEHVIGRDMDKPCTNILATPSKNLRAGRIDRERSSFFFLRPIHRSKRCNVHHNVNTVNHVSNTRRISNINLAAINPDQPA